MTKTKDVQLTDQEKRIGELTNYIMELDLLIRCHRELLADERLKRPLAEARNAAVVRLEAARGE